jgi:hypothetical protein
MDPTGQQIYGGVVNNFAGAADKQPIRDVMDQFPQFSHGSASMYLASKQLDAAGIPGLKFLDYASRGRPSQALRYTGDEELHPDIGHLMNTYRTVNKPLDFDTMRDVWVNSRDSSIVMGQLGRYQSGLDFLDRNKGNFELHDPRTRNYVIFNPKNLNIETWDGKKLQPVDHDPFAPGG